MTTTPSAPPFTSDFQIIQPDSSGTHTATPAGWSPATEKAVYELVMGERDTRVEYECITMWGSVQTYHVEKIGALLRIDTHDEEEGGKFRYLTLKRVGHKNYCHSERAPLPMKVLVASSSKLKLDCMIEEKRESPDIVDSESSSSSFLSLDSSDTHDNGTTGAACDPHNEIPLFSGAAVHDYDVPGSSASVAHIKYSTNSESEEEHEAAGHTMFTAPDDLHPF